MGRERFLALFFPEFPLQHLMREGADPGAWIAVVEPRQSGGARVCARSPNVAAAGVQAGWAVPQARARVPGLTFLNRDATGEARALEGIAEALGWVSPRIAWAKGAGMILEIAGASHLHGGEGGLEERLRSCLEEQEVQARSAVADRAKTACVLAEHGAGAFRIVPPGADAAAIGPLPIAVLGDAEEIGRELAAVGIATVEEVASLEAAELARRFGERGVRVHQQARGMWSEPLDWRRPRAPLEERMDLPHPCWEVDGLVFALQSLLMRLEGRMRGRGVAAVEWDLALEMDLVPKRVERFQLGSPLRSASALLAMARHRLQRLCLPEPVVALAVRALRERAFEGVQEGLLDGSASAREPLNALLARLSAELGDEAVHSLLPVDSHRPERAVSRAPFQPGQRALVAQPPRGVRPTRLLSPPDPLEMMPSARAVIWQGRRRRFRAIDAAERIAGEWWAEPYHRDYHVMRMEEGGVWWVYRDLRGGGWWLHGFFE